MIKAVLDTNILISSLFWKGAPYEIVQKGIGGAFIIVLSPEIIRETEDKLKNKFKFSVENTNAFLEVVALNSFIVEPMIKLRVVKTDSTDNKIIECAVAGNVDYIVSGDKYLLNIKKHEQINIINPSKFLKLL